MSLFSIETPYTARALVRVLRNIVIRPVGEAARGAETGEEIWTDANDAARMHRDGSVEIIEAPEDPNKPKSTPRENAIRAALRAPVEIALEPLPEHWSALPSCFTDAWNQASNLNRLRAVAAAWARRNRDRQTIGQAEERLAGRIHERAKTAAEAVDEFNLGPFGKFLRECSKFVSARLAERNSIAAGIRHDARELFADRLAPLELGQGKVDALFVGSGLYWRYENSAPERSLSRTLERIESGALVPMVTGSLNELASWALMLEADMPQLASLRQQLDAEILAAKSAIAATGSSKRKTV